MQDKSDAELLREYVRNGNEAAFGIIVKRHADLIYSAALRQVSSSDAAGDVTQSVFTDLARKANSLTDSIAGNSSILGWLYRSTRFAALTYLRDERRRRDREREVMEQSVASSESLEPWDSLCPVLDEAMAELSDPDREAILLRFFSNQDFQKIGATLGVSDDTAQKRVSRALEKLRRQLMRKGVGIGTAVLATALTANAVHATPVGLTSAISSSALLAGLAQTTTTAATGKVLIMTTTQKVLVATTLVAALGTEIYQTYQAAQLREKLQTFSLQPAVSGVGAANLQSHLAELEARLARAEEENERLRKENGEIHKLRGEVTRLRKASQELREPSADPTMSEAVAWKQRVQSLKQHLQDNPNVGIPELRLASENDWLDAARGALQTERDFRRAMADLRAEVQMQFTATLVDVVQKYMAANGENFPTHVSQLRPYFDSPVDDAMLQRYTLVPAETVPSLKLGGDWVLTQASAVDEEFDTRNVIGPNGYGSTEGKPAWDQTLVAAKKSLKPAMDAYAAANPGKAPSDPEALLPYLKTQEQREAFERLRASRAPKQ